MIVYSINIIRIRVHTSNSTFPLGVNCHLYTMLFKPMSTVASHPIRDQFESINIQVGINNLLIISSTSSSSTSRSESRSTYAYKLLLS